jgi:hypothetical protein
MMTRWGKLRDDRVNPMSEHNEKWIHDGNGRKIPLRSDPEGIAKNKSFRLMTSGRIRSLKEDPRICVVLGMREYPNLTRCPATRQERISYVASLGINIALIWLILYAMVFAGIWGYRDPRSILISLLIAVGYQLIYQYWSLRYGDRRRREIEHDLATNPFYCAGCWYPLECDPDPDGFVICPECGAAWAMRVDQERMKDDC